MQIDTAGIYTLQYTAEDECGNVTVEERTVSVENLTYRTVLYTDGTLIINEKSSDIDANIALHGAATNEYAPFNPNGSTNTEKYIFSSSSRRPWNGVSSDIESVEIGSIIAPPQTRMWFLNLTNCTSVDLSLLDTSSTISMAGMFGNCSSLANIDVSNFNTSNVTDMSSMFTGCSSLTSLDLSNFNTGNVTNISSMFYDCSALTSIDLSNFNTSNVTRMEFMFDGCSSLTSIDVSSFNTSNVTNMQNLFRKCSSLTSLDLSNFNTGNVTDMRGMFSQDEALVTIYASVSFVVSQVTSSNDMFTSTSRLVGGAGTASAVGSNPKDKTYARIDNPPTAPGYFTLKAA